RRRPAGCQGGRPRRPPLNQIPCSVQFAPVPRDRQRFLPQNNFHLSSEPPPFAAASRSARHASAHPRSVPETIFPVWGRVGCRKPKNHRKPSTQKRTFRRPDSSSSPPSPATSASREQSKGPNPANHRCARVSARASCSLRCNYTQQNSQAHYAPPCHRDSPMWPRHAAAVHALGRNRRRSPRANCQSKKPSICRPNAAPYPYHQTFFTPGRRSESRYLILTISSRPNRPCVRPMPLAFTPPCGASLIPKHDTVSFTITVPA